MAENDVQYETKDVHALRGTEDRARAKAEADGWEFVEIKARSAIRSTMTFRRPKKRISLKAWIIGGAAAAVLVGIIVTGAALERANAPEVLATPTPTVQIERVATSSPEPTAATVPTDTAVDDAEVLAAFNEFFAERATAGVMLGKAVTEVTFADGVVRVTFDPAAAGVTQQDFDAFNPFENLANFAATPVAFNNELGNRVRPAIDSIETLRADGVPLGTYSRADILALNELEK
ncbi:MULTISPECIES: hypothetical protein [unclassified Microbacterium]|uniref:hypothetical protein n=1 Tax=unclassified Microbacterium TaxID=2609290 RepID=UPI00301B3820